MTSSPIDLRMPLIEPNCVKGYASTLTFAFIFVFTNPISEFFKNIFASVSPLGTIFKSVSP